MIRILAGMLCGLAFAAPMPASASVQDDEFNHLLCPLYMGQPMYCAPRPPEEVARLRALFDDSKRRSAEQDALTAPTTTPDLTLVCTSKDHSETVQIWLSAELLA
jgi:hypothetical protein